MKIKIRKMIKSKSYSVENLYSTPKAFHNTAQGRASAPWEKSVVRIYLPRRGCTTAELALCNPFAVDEPVAFFLPGCADATLGCVVQRLRRKNLVANKASKTRSEIKTAEPSPTLSLPRELSHATVRSASFWYSSHGLGADCGGAWVTLALNHLPTLNLPLNSYSSLA